MTKDEQKQFVEEYFESLKKDMLLDIEKGKIPENWDGIEFRWLAKERTGVWKDYDKRNRKRKSTFTNTVLVNNL